jgi:hypothetical protein
VPPPSSSSPWTSVVRPGDGGGDRCSVMVSRRALLGRACDAGGKGKHTDQPTGHDNRHHALSAGATTRPFGGNGGNGGSVSQCFYMCVIPKKICIRERQETFPPFPSFPPF